ncbi:hypothetical protein ATZ33_16490 [Enterococcus silesiacus]|nr:hypothetical protein [Enterococcus silesiacus]ALS02920.1 hypothetical protein ATZ33_16490 [Enterococcus silesiacus]
MDENLLLVLYFLVVVIVVLTLVIVKDKQFLRSLLSKKELQQEEITELMLEKVRLKHIIRMQDETIAHMLTTNTPVEINYSKQSVPEEPVVQEWDLDQFKSMNQEYYHL